jgi:hypothetical protein
MASLATAIGCSMTDISFTNLQVNPDAGASPRELKEAQYRLPALPKMSIVFNINAAILSPILTVLFALVNRHAFLENAGYLIIMIAYFTFGSLVAVASCIFDYKATCVYNKSTTKKRTFVDFAEICDGCVFVTYMASLVIFTSGAIFEFYLVSNIVA